MAVLLPACKQVLSNNGLQIVPWAVGDCEKEDCFVFGSTLGPVVMYASN